MLIYALNFLLGISVFSFKNTLEISSNEWVLILCGFLAIFTLFKHQKPLSLNGLVFLLGFAWMGWFSVQNLNTHVDEIYLNQSILVTGVIADLPEASTDKTKFIFYANSPFKSRLKLSWYGKNRPALQTGDAWQLQLKLKRNNGYQNLGGFDYEQWLFYKQMGATGYVRSSKSNQLIQVNQTNSMDQFRQDLRYSLQPFLQALDFGGVVNALIIGDRSFIKESHWELFKDTNTTHLSVISGLHIGLISGFVFLLVQFLWRRCQRCCHQIPAQVLAAYFGLLSAFLYALIAGFSIPTGRAFIMAGVVFVSLILRRHHNVWQLYGLALILVLANNPLSIFSVGFWLSFYVVGVIIYGVKQHQDKSWMFRLLYIQLLISVATLPLIAWFFASGSLLSPIANLVAIPVFSFIVTPLSLIGAILVLIGLSYPAELSFAVADQALAGLSYFLGLLQQFEFNQWHYTQTQTLDLILFVLAVFITLTPKGLKLRLLSVPILALMLLVPNQKIAQNTALITILDVGQGISHVVQTQNHTLLFDTGARYPSGFNLGGSVINPFLKAKQVNVLDKVIVSHADNDHIGGLTDVLQAFKVKEILTSTPNKITRQSSLCYAGQQWRWDGVLFEILSPTKNTRLKGNNASCVLKVSTDQFSVLMSADIERKAEKQLVKHQQEKLNSDILLSPHHGSKTSSTQAFLDAVSPSIIIISSGYQNRFNHPAKQVTDRYKANKIKSINTNCAGQINIKLGAEISINEYRKDHARYYNRQCSDL
ncbi:MAG TPA: DNA internalization-related competence protein ComEC/Rec2 [Gammaproteobacteria bacterium]|nr:DNA internalization-related competence protein ComEC/Rec2 [Gammaproteobacteria bacterium]